MTVQSQQSPESMPAVPTLNTTHMGLGALQAGGCSAQALGQSSSWRITDAAAGREAATARSLAGHADCFWSLEPSAPALHQVTECSTRCCMSQISVCVSLQAVVYTGLDLALCQLSGKLFLAGLNSFVIGHAHHPASLSKPTHTDYKMCSQDTGVPRREAGSTSSRPRDGAAAAAGRS